ncbi:MAG: acyl-CoA dehydrogenase family protein [Gammaproteobacteria bacterium]|nr:acyl-CoA dehydrogenase family protein [Gammaproteobacteria bacterium]MDH3429630.1 acyl-CoA dehydrogenase family protein [Gammaproteobacteria bacterium]MDH3434067.1 acyl-CoA dehydrogenase family protein [Gammaproteobacteria bacterium]
MSDSDEFRQQTRAWLEENCPASMRRPIRSDKDQCWGGRNWVFESEDQRLWLERMAERGWTAPQWPAEYGGGGLTREQAKILQQEMARILARRPLESFGIDMLGPALFKFASEEQKKRFIPEIIRGEIRWCQGYSEPNAGSDLASLQTRADDKGDHYLVNGSKVWTSYADKSDWIFCLVRTNFEAPKHQGISFLLFDMASPGVSTNPVRLISGNSPFCETVFENVKVPKENLVGELNKGWDIAKYLLTHEREMIGGFGLSRAGSETLGQTALAALGEAQGQLAANGLRSDISDFEIDEMAFALTIERVVDEAKAGHGTGAASSVLKLYGTELNKARNELLMSIGGSGALAWGSEGKMSMAQNWLRSKGNSIEGGSSEIQLNIIAKRILGLPG